MVRDIPLSLVVSLGYFCVIFVALLPCQDKLPEFHCTPILGCSRGLWFVFQPLALRLDKALCGWNSVRARGFAGILLGTEQAPNADEEIDRKKSYGSYE